MGCRMSPGMIDCAFRIAGIAELARIERAEYVLRGSYVQRIEYLEQRVQVLEREAAA